MSGFKVSVIIPVYNAEKYLRKAVESAINLDEVGEVLLIEDKSPDKALMVCKELEKEYECVKLFRHPDKENHGAGASRNLGIEKSQYEYIAFLDADDYFLPNRFVKDKEILLKNPEIDGVYNALGIIYYSEQAKKKFLDAGYQYQEFLTLSDIVHPEELFFVLFGCHPNVKGEFSTITITVRRDIFEKVGVFNPKLPLKQDIHLWRKMAAKCKLAAGNLKEPVAIRGVHENNRMVNKQLSVSVDKYWYKDLHKWLRKQKVKKAYMECFEKSYLYFKIKRYGKFQKIFEFTKYYLKRPKLILSSASFDFYFIEVFGRNWCTLHSVSFKNRLFSKK
jgi:glycosyltransferase involved in cell wall biosynthesis